MTTMAVLKWPEKVKELGEKMNYTMCGGLYKEEDKVIVPWSGTYPYAKMNCFTWPIEGKC